MTTVRERTAPIALPRLPIRGRALPVWIPLVVGYLASRVFSTGLLALAFSLSIHGVLSSGANFDHGFLHYLESWDGLHYRRIVDHGYPTQLPVNAAGDVERNPWAFLPLYPMLVRGVALAFGVDAGVGAILVSVLFGGAATIALYKLMVPRIGVRSATWTALFFCFGPMSFLFEVAYADSVFLFFIFLSLVFMVQRRWLLMIPFGVAAAFAHPGALALALAIGIVCAARLARRETIKRSELFAAAAAIIAISVAGFAWPAISAFVTGDPSAYFDTESAWWTSYIGHVDFVPFTPWLIFSSHYAGAAGVGMIVLGLIVFVVWMRRSARLIGDDILAFTMSFLAYLFAVFLPQQSVVRMLLPLAPLAGDSAFTLTPTRRRVTLAVGILLQPFAVLLFWVIWPP